MNKEITINQQDLIDWIDRSPSNNDLDLIDYIVNRLENFYKLDEEIARLNKIIDELEKWNNEKSKGRLERTPYDEVNIKLQELKEEGKE